MKEEADHRSGDDAQQHPDPSRFDHGEDDRVEIHVARRLRESAEAKTCTTLLPPNPLLLFSATPGCRAHVSRGRFNRALSSSAFVRCACPGTKPSSNASTQIAASSAP